MGLIRYSCGHISGPHEPIPTQFGPWMFFIMLYRYASKTLKSKKKVFCDVIASVLYNQIKHKNCHSVHIPKRCDGKENWDEAKKNYEYVYSSTSKKLLGAMHVFFFLIFNFTDLKTVMRNLFINRTGRYTHRDNYIGRGRILFHI